MIVVGKRQPYAGPDIPHAGHHAWNTAGRFGHLKIDKENCNGHLLAG